MHEALLSRAALPAPAIVLGLRLRPFSLGHYLWLEREQISDLQISNLKSAIESLPAAVLICSQSWTQLTRVPGFDPLLSLKMWLWGRAIRKASKVGRVTPCAPPGRPAEDRRA